MIGIFELDWSDNKDHFYDPVRGGAIGIYTKHTKSKKKIGMKSPICIRTDMRSDSYTVLRKGTDQLLKFIKSKKNKVDQNGVLDIRIALGRKQSNDEVPPPTHFDRQNSTGTASIHSPLKMMAPTAGNKSACYNNKK